MNNIIKRVSFILLILLTEFFAILNSIIANYVPLCPKKQLLSNLNMWYKTKTI